MLILKDLHVYIIYTHIYIYIYVYRFVLHIVVADFHAKESNSKLNMPHAVCGIWP